MTEEEVAALRLEYREHGYGIIRYDDGPVHSYPYDAPWLDDETFAPIYDKIRYNTLVDRSRCYSLFSLVQQVADVEGDILEVGTWRGGTAGILTTSAPGKTVYLADTFEGVVKSSDWEHYNDRRHDDTSVQIVEDLLSHTLGVSNYEILQGIFPEDTGSKIKDVPLSLVYLDLDVYLSTRDAFQYVWGNVSRQGIVVFDDYGFLAACPGIKKFVDEIKNDTDKLFIMNGNGQAYIIKK